MLKKEITGYDLKMLALVTMVIDHIAAMYIFTDSLSIDGISLGWVIIGIAFRCIGRLSFTLYAYLLVQGYVYTRNKVKYAGRILLLAILSEIPFNLFFFSTYVNSRHQNILFTLLLAFLAIGCLDYFSKFENNKILFQILSVLLFGTIAEAIRSDYGFFGVLFICCLYIYRNNKKQQIIVSSIALFFCGIGQILGALSFLPISKYHGQQGRKLNYAFYLFYPVHLVILYLIKITFLKL